MIAKGKLRAGPGPCRRKATYQAQRVTAPTVKSLLKTLENVSFLDNVAVLDGLNAIRKKR